MSARAAKVRLIAIGSLSIIFPARLLIVGQFLGVIDHDHFNFAFCRFQFQSDPLDCGENIRAVDRRSGHAAGGRE